MKAVEIILCVGLSVVADVAAFSEKTGETGSEFNYCSYAYVLETYVSSQGMVDYRGLQRNRAELDLFVESLGALTGSDFRRWSDAERLAFWINAYNALTLKVVIDHYPIKAGFFRSFLYPKNSIRQIPGVWDSLEFHVLDRNLTLDQIEHQIIRKEFQEPRMHVALVCAAKSCPPLRDEPYRGETLEEQFEDQARQFLSSPENFRIDRERDLIYLSSIFDWFKQDFADKFRPGANGFSGASGAERSVLAFIGSYLPERDARFLREGRYEIVYLDYDWSLNEQ